MNKLIFTVLMCFSLAAHADSPTPESSDAWKDAEPDVQVSVVRVADADDYKVNAVVSDLRTGTILARPELLVRAGTPARFELGAEGQVRLTFNVTVDASGKTATYEWEVRGNGQLTASDSVTLPVAPSLTEQ